MSITDLKNWKPNPFTITHDCVWAMIEQCIDLSVIKCHNRIKYSKCNQDPLKKTVTDGDVPELEVLPEGFSGNLVDTSNGSRIKFRIAVITSTGCFDYNGMLAQIQFMLLRCAMLLKKNAGFCGTWKGRRFLESVRLLDEKEGITQQSRTNRPDGWTAVMRLEFCLCLAQDDICEKPTCVEIGENPNFENDDWWDFGTWDVGEGQISGSGVLCSPDLDPDKTYVVGVYVRPDWTSPQLSIHGNTITEPGWHTFELSGINKLLVDGNGTIGHISITES